MKGLATLSNKITNVTGKVGLKVRKYSPEILLGAGIVGFAGTVVLACKATLSADDILEFNREKMSNINEAWDIAQAEPETYNYDLDLYRKDKFIVTTQTAVKFVKLYAPTVAVGALSLACILTSRNILQKRYLGAVCAYNAVSGAFGEYRKRVIEEQGELMDRHYYYGTDIETIDTVEVDENGKKHKTKEVIENADPSKIHPDDTSRVFDSSNPNFSTSPEMSMYFLKGQEMYANDVLNQRGHIFLNEIYRALGFDDTQAGAVLGWVKGQGDDYVDFGLCNQSRGRRFVNGTDQSILLTFNHDGVIWDKIS